MKGLTSEGHLLARKPSDIPAWSLGHEGSRMSSNVWTPLPSIYHCRQGSLPTNFPWKPPVCMVSSAPEGETYFHPAGRNEQHFPPHTHLSSCGLYHLFGCTQEWFCTMAFLPDPWIGRNKNKTVTNRCTILQLFGLSCMVGVTIFFFILKVSLLVALDLNLFYVWGTLNLMYAAKCSMQRSGSVSHWKVMVSSMCLLLLLSLCVLQLFIMCTEKLGEQLSYSIKVNNIDCVCVSYLNLWNVK